MPSVDDQTLFIALVESGSFHGAANRLKISSSVASRQLKRIERELGVQLLNRTTRSMSLTQPGKLFYESCRRIEEEKRSAQQLIQNLSAKPVGKLKITATPAFAHARLIDAIGDFSNRYPDIQFELVITDQHIDLVDSDIDIAIRIGDLRDSRLKSRRLLQARLLACAAPGYLARYGYPHALSDLARHRVIFSSHLPEFEKRHQASFPDLSVPEQQKVLIANDVLSIYRAAQAGVGITLLPDYLVRRDIERGDLTELFAGQLTMPHEVFALFQGVEFMPYKTRVFIDFLAERFG